MKLASAVSRIVSPDGRLFFPCVRILCSFRPFCFGRLGHQVPRHDSRGVEDSFLASGFSSPGTLAFASGLSSRPLSARWVAGRVPLGSSGFGRLTSGPGGSAWLGSARLVRLPSGFSALE
ncbi:unnamed protein product [Polarella glacialis]|uniref:Uncharacterized protein n=1 Tax=Polarella glacialis TaxID=89957 RepID=A0A813L9F1_POLGL|nr:unnamed protein product [Polarella glacialis]